MQDTTKPPTGPVYPGSTHEPPLVTTTGDEGDGGFCTEYVNRWGKRMVAAEYGYKAWHFRKRTGRKEKP